MTREEAKKKAEEAIESWCDEKSVQRKVFGNDFFYPLRDSFTDLLIQTDREAREEKDAMIERLKKENEALEGCVASCQATISSNKRQWGEDVKSLQSQVDTMRKALKRLASMEAFHIATHNVSEETRRRVIFAEEALKTCEGGGE